MYYDESFAWMDVWMYVWMYECMDNQLLSKLTEELVAAVGHDTRGDKHAGTCRSTGAHQPHRMLCMRPH